MIPIETFYGATIAHPRSNDMSSFPSLRTSSNRMSRFPLTTNGDPPRQIYLDGRGHPTEFNPSWMGHSVGHWEDDTLVVETVGFNELAWLQNGFFPQTEKLRITERFRRTDLGHLQVETTYDDPSAFKKPFTIRRINSVAPKDWEVLEY